MAAAWEDDDAAAFPRGGGGALSGLEHRRIAAEARRDAEEEILAFSRKKGGKKRDRAETDTNDAAARTKFKVEEGGRLDTLLRSRDLAKGSLLLGAVNEVSSSRITLQLPGRLTGTVAREEVSDELRAAIQDGDLEHVPDLRKLFKLGEVFSVAVLTLPPPPPSDDRRIFKRPSVELTLRLSLTQAKAASVDGDAANAISAGSPLWATLSSVEAHGAIMSIGGHPSGAFLHKKHWSDKGTPPPRWRPVLLSAVSAPQPRRPLQLCAGTAATLRPPPAEAPISMASLTAGSLVRASVVDVEEGGLRLQIADLFEATVDVDNTPVSSREWASAFSRGQRVVARVLWVLPHSKRIGCSLRPHLTQRALLRCVSASAEGAISGESDDATVSADHTEIDGVIASPRDVTDLEKNQSAVDAMSNLKPGQTLEAVVLGANWLEARAVVSTRKSVVERDTLYDISLLKPGQVVSGSIARLDDRGAKVRVGFGVFGRVSVDNFTDQKLTKPQKRFKVGEKHKCLVLECNSASKKLMLSMKPALVNSTLPRITKNEDCVPGVLSHGVVASVRPNALVVAFLNGVRGVVFGSELRATLGAVWESDPTSCYSLGQTVRCRVVTPHQNKKLAQLSFLTEEEARSTPTGLAGAAGAAGPALSMHPFGAGGAMALCVGESVSGVVARVCGDGGIWVKLTSTDGHAYLPSNHLTDTVALEPVARAALRVGTPLPPLMVLMIQKRHQRGAGKVTVTAKPSLLIAHANRALPSSAEHASTLGKVLAGYVYKISAEGCVIGFLGGLRGSCDAAHVADGLLLAPARLVQLGQTVRAAVLPKKGGGVSKEMLVVSLLASDCCANASGAANGDEPVADAASAKGKNKSKSKNKNKGKVGAEMEKDALPSSASAFAEPWRVAAMRASAEGAAKGSAEEAAKGSAEEGQNGPGRATVAEAEAAVKAFGISLPKDCISTLNAVFQVPSIGSVVQLEVIAKPKHADESPELKALINVSGGESASVLHAVCAPSKAALGGRSKWKVGDKLSAVLIDVDPLSSLLTVSMQAELLAAATERAASSGGAKGAQARKAKQGAAVEVAEVPSDGEQVQFQVLLVKAGLVVGCLPNHGFVVCVAAPHRSWHWAGMKATELATAAGRLAVGEVVSATVISHASATQADDALGEDFYAKAAAAAARAPMLVSLAVSAGSESLLVAARAVASSSGAEPHRLRSREHAKVGAHAQGVVTSMGKESFRVRLDKKGFVIGHLHFTEVAEPGKDAVMPKVANGEPLHVVLLSECDANGKTSASVNGQAKSAEKLNRAHFVLSVRPSALAGGTTRRIVSASQLKVGQQVDGWVKFVGTSQMSGLWVALSESVSGYVSSAYVRDDVPHGAALQDHFKFGQALHARVLELPTEKDGISIPLKLTLRESISSKRKAPEPASMGSRDGKEKAASAERPAKKAKRGAAADAAAAVLPSANSVVSVTITRAIAGVGYFVSLDDACVGRVHLTEVVDEWVESPLSTYKIGATTEAVVIGMVNAHANLTLRKSVLAEALSQPKAFELKQKHARPASTEEIAEGQLVRGYVKQVTERGVFLSLSCTVDAFVGLKFVSEDFVKAHKLAERLPVGQLVVGRVIARAQPATSGKPSTLPAVSLRLGDVKGGVFKQKIVFADLHPGMVVSGIVRRIVDFGVFVRLASDGERLDALCHVSELVDGKVKDAQTSFEIGSQVKAVVLKTDPEKKQISISLKPSRLKELGVQSDDDGSDDDSDEDEGDQAMANDDSAQAQVAAESDEEDASDMEIEGDDESFDELDLSDDADGSDVDESSKGALELDDDDDDDVKPTTAARVPRAAVPRKLSDLSMPKSSLSVGFEWDDFAPAAGAKRGKTGAKPAADEDDEEAEIEEIAAAAAERRGRRGRRAVEAQSVRQKEAAIAARESTLLQPDGAPQTAEDFERLLVGAPNSSMLWVQYMQHQLALAEVERAKEVGERALKSIDVREESERFNIWVAMLNLELAHGDSSSLGEMFRRASAGSSPIPIYLHMASAHERAGDGAAADGVFTAASKKFRSDKRVWLAWLSSLMRRGQHEIAKELLQRTVDTLPKADHVEVLSKYAQLEFRHGLAERGRTVFDGMLSSFPKRVDVWSVYIDMELREKDDAVIRRLFERVVSLKLSSKKIKFFFGRYLAYARSINDADLAQHVKEAARAWVEKATATETS